ncbi:MAG: GAF domain-containing protein [Firmicutes bacterium]|jgi:sugar diacid utilization regulator|nr:GAF domain-containing protein [Bacillota bacterium]
MAEYSYENKIQGALTSEFDRFGIKANCDKNACKAGCLNIRKELLKERKRVIQWRILNEATVILNSRLHSESLPLKFIKCAKKLVSAREAMLALKEENGTGLRIVKHYTYYDHYNQFEELGQRAKPQEKLVEDQVYEPQGVIKIILEKGEIIDRNSTRFRADDLFGFSAIKKNLLGVPLTANNKVIGALLAANKYGEESFNEDDRELLVILGTQLGIALENSRLYEKVDEKLQLKVEELERLNEKLLKQQKMLEKSSEIHKKLTELVLRGRGIEAICSTLAAFINCPVQIEDKDFNIKATTAQNETDTKSFLCGKDLILDSSYSRQVKELFHDRKPVEIVLGPERTQYLVPIVAGEQILGLLTALSNQGNLKQLYRTAMEQGATITALEMLKEKAAVEQTKRLKENFIEHVLEGNFESDDWVQHRALQLGFDLEKCYQIIALEIEPDAKCRCKPELYQEIREFCMNSFPDVVVVTKSSYITMMFVYDRGKQPDGARPLVDLLKERLPGVVKGGNWWIALGTHCDSLEKCVLSYRNAITTLGIMKSLKLKNRVICYDNLGIFSLIEINSRCFARFIKKALGPLVEYDQKHRTQLVETLNLYYKYNGNVLMASRKGYLNPSTMKYRLRRIKEITGLDYKDADVSLQLQLAIRLLNYDCPEV